MKAADDKKYAKSMLTYPTCHELSMLKISNFVHILHVIIYAKYSNNKIISNWLICQWFISNHYILFNFIIYSCYSNFRPCSHKPIVVRYVCITMVVINKAPKLFNEYLIYLCEKRLYVVFPITVKDSFQTESKYPTEPCTEQF